MKALQNSVCSEKTFSSISKLPKKCPLNFCANIIFSKLEYLLLFPTILDSRETSYKRELSQKPLNQHLEKNVPHINANFGFKRLTNQIFLQMFAIVECENIL